MRKNMLYYICKQKQVDLQQQFTKKNKNFNCKRKELNMSNTVNNTNTNEKANTSKKAKVITSFEKLEKLATIENVQNIFNAIECDMFAKSLTKSELLKVVIYNEIRKMFNEKDTHCAILQCCYALTKHQDSNSYNLIRVVEKEKQQNALTNIYITVKQNKVFCKCTVSANKAYQDILKDNDYDIVKHYKTVELENLANEIKTLRAIFKSVK